METEFKPPQLGKLRLQIIEDAIRAMEWHPESVDMRVWVSHDEDVPPNPDGIEGYCGTVACLAGHIGLAAGLPPREEVTLGELKQNGRTRRLRLDVQLTEDARINWNDNKWENRRVEIADVAAKILQLEGDELRLFTLGGWPYRFRYDYRRAKTGKGRAGAMIRRLRYYLETGK